VRFLASARRTWSAATSARAGVFENLIAPLIPMWPRNSRSRRGPPGATAAGQPQAVYLPPFYHSEGVHGISGTGLGNSVAREAWTGRSMSSYASAGWRAAGACASADPDLFFPVSSSGRAIAQIDQARRVCASCLVRRQCLDFAMETVEAEGIWGGTTADERISHRRETARRRAAQPDVA
jgi:WhiB family redox-sensing transcriptional regulator